MMSVCPLVGRITCVVFAPGKHWWSRCGRSDWK